MPVWVSLQSFLSVLKAQRVSGKDGLGQPTPQRTLNRALQVPPSVMFTEVELATLFVASEAKRKRVQMLQQ